ncbi:hypothetical protein L829_1631 [Mycobacteroides abscessus MAB_030201_1075]|uniref:Uncharacterized protein n=1 Tax=Mycobacteroides abscessus MAB_030201_1075 TaxID=1335410 RepID=A0A829PLS9_9MYCO|nr:hypothetical protein L829_1631 [Mycobacteroides abscessus MAB_030201_1075]
MRPDRDAAPPRPIRIRKLPVRVEQRHHPVGTYPQRLGPKLGGHHRQLRLGRLAGRSIDHYREPVKEVADDPEVFLTNVAAPQRLRGMGQLGCQLLAGDRALRRQQLGVGDPPARAAPLPICKRRDNTSAYDVPPSCIGEACPVTAEIKPSPREANRRCTTSRRANTANASPAVRSSIDSA